jgi:hypothetical protein
MALAGFTLLSRPFAIWPGTLQLMPAGILDAGFNRFFVGVLLSNGSTLPWPATEVHVSARGAATLAAAGITVENDWSDNDAAAVGQSTSSEWISVPALAAGGSYAIYLKMDVRNATTGRHLLDLELREAAAHASTARASAPLLVTRTACHGSRRTFTSICDDGTLTAAVSSVSLDQEVFRRVLKKARDLAGLSSLGYRTPAETERLRRRLRDVPAHGPS